MPYTRPSLEDLIARIESDFNNRVESSTTFTRRSVFKIFSRVLGGAIHLIYEYINFFKDQLFISTADAEYLDRHGAEFVFYRNYGERATGNIIVTGTAGTSIAAGTSFQNTDGLVYTSTSTISIAVGGTVSVNIIAEKVGEDYNITSGEVVNFVSPIANVTTSAIVDSTGIINGENEETDDEFRQRLLLRKSRPPHGGIEHDYEVWALEYPEVTRAWTEAHYYGVGTIGVGFVFDNRSNIFPTEADRILVKNYIVSHTDTFLGVTVGCPITAEPGLIMIELQPLTVNLSIGIYPNTSEVQTAVQSALEELILQKGGVGRTIYVSEIYQIVANATGEERCQIISPTSDVTTATNQVHVLGDITWSLYNG